MAKLTGKQIQELAKSIIASNSGGIRYSTLVDQIWKQNPETPVNTIHGNVWDLNTTFPSEVAKPSRAASLRPRLKLKMKQFPSEALSK